MTRVHGIGLCLLMTACGASTAPPPRTGASTASEGYPGRCALLGVEQSAREGDSNTDSVELVARYQPDGEGPLPFGLAFQVRRERVDDLRAHLEQHPSVLCRPELGDGEEDDSSYELELPPFEGQQGDYRPEAPEAPAGSDPEP